MDNDRTGITRNGGLTSLMRVIRSFAEGSLVALGFAVTILFIGMPLALFVGGLHEGLSGLVRLRGDTSALAESLVSIASVAGGLVLTGVFVRRLVGFFNSLRRFRARVSNESRGTFSFSILDLAPTLLRRDVHVASPTEAARARAERLHGV